MVYSLVDWLWDSLAPYAEYLWPRLILSTLHAPTLHIYFELTLISGIIWLLFQRSYRIKDVIKLTEKERAKLIEEWRPDPLVPANWAPPKKVIEQIDRQAISAVGKYVTFEKNPSKKLLNMASYNFLNLVEEASLVEAARKAMLHYGVGSCGPRGFYGTFDAHLKFEADMEKFLNVEEVILYSYGFSTMASAIPSYAKRTDIIFADEMVNQAIYQGLLASRSLVKFFKHNDMSSLERLLVFQAEEDAKDPNKARTIRRFLVVEGLYQDTGYICDLPKLIDLKYQYKVRLFVDESLSIGTLGRTGRGLTEHYGVDSKHIDLIAGNLETAFANYGGFCAGSKYVIDHQRLSGAGYCFSASSPPMLAVSMCESLQMLIAENGLRQEQLKSLSGRFADAFAKSPIWMITGDRDSPLKHMRLKQCNTLDSLERVVELAQKHDETMPLLLTVARLLPSEKPHQPEPSLRIALNCSLTDGEIDSAVNIIEKCGLQASSATSS